MHYHVHYGINVWSKCNGHRCYSYRAMCKSAKITPYYNVFHEAI